MPTPSIRRTVLALAGLTLLAASAMAQAPEHKSVALPDWPTQPVKFIIPFGPGAGADISGRLIQERLQKMWGRPVVIENRPGGDGIVALSAFVTANDPHVLLYSATGSFAVHPYQHDKLPYDAERDLKPIARVTNTILAIGVPAAMNIGSLKAFVEAAKAAPGKMNVALVPGITEFVYDGFVHDVGLDMHKVPYRDIVQAGTDVGEGRIQFMMASLAILQPGVQGGRIKLIALNGHDHTSLAPGVPTVFDEGFPSAELEGLVGLLGPKVLPLDIRERIAADVIAVTKDPDIATRLVGSAQVVNPGTPAEFEAAMKKQADQIAGIAGRIGVARRVQ